MATAATSATRSGTRRADARTLGTGAAVLLLACAGGALAAHLGTDALILGGSLLAGGLVLFDFRIGVALLVLLMPVSGSAVFPRAMLGITGLNPLNLLLVATLASWLLQRVAAGRLPRFVPRPLFWLYLVPIVVAAALGVRHVPEILPAFYASEMVAFHDAPGYLRDMLAKPLLMVVYALLVAAAVQDTPLPRGLLACAVASVLVMSGMAVVFVLAGGTSLAQLGASDQREFLSPLGLHANELGRFYVCAFALLLFGRAAVHGVALRAAITASLALVVAALLLTFSRSAFLGLLVTVGLYLWWRPAARAPALIGLLVLGAVFVVPSAFLERLGSGFGRGLDAVSAGRIEGLWLPLLPEALASPVWGHGLGSILWSDAMRRAGGGTVLGVTHPHSAYLQALLDMGLVGLLLVLAFFGHVARRLRRLATDPRVDPLLRGFFDGAAAALLAFLLTAAFDSSFVPKPEHALLWFAIGVMYGQRPGATPDRR